MARQAKGRQKASTGNTTKEAVTTKTNGCGTKRAAADDFAVQKRRRIQSNTPLAASGDGLTAAADASNSNDTTNQPDGTNLAGNTAANPTILLCQKCYDGSGKAYESRFRWIYPDKKTKREDKSTETGLNRTLPPIPNVYVAFDDLMKKALENHPAAFNKIIGRGGIAFRFATMCSGTDAPYFALKLMQESLLLQGKQEVFRFEHVFGVEIDPAKQAFLSLNTEATIFRDVREMANETCEIATTAHGSKAEIPRNIQLLVAGTSCVDFSALNTKKKSGFSIDIFAIAKEECSAAEFAALCEAQSNAEGEDDDLKKKGSKGWGLIPTEDLMRVMSRVLNAIKGKLDEGGESDTTFFSMLLYAKKYRPSMIILENVSGAPWKDARDVWLRGIGYTAEIIALDTKDFYMPQTRKRMYLVAMDMQAFPGIDLTQVVTQWQTILGGLKRRASSSIEDYLLQENSRLIQIARQELEHKAEGKKSRDKEWFHSLQRHNRARRNEGLGQSRPLTQWTDAGCIKLYDRMDPIIIGGQAPRVWDLLDINFLRGIFSLPGFISFDNRFKMKHYDLSQNVDRGVVAHFGLAGCLTPNGIPFLGDQCRFITGYEALALQGLPLERLDMSRQTQDQLKDLAGNAMTTTVVGATILASFIALAESDGDSFRIFKTIAGSGYQHPLLNPQASGPFGQKAFGPENLELFKAESGVAFAVQEVLNILAKARRYCRCNGTAKYSSDIFLICVDCGIIRCANCAGNPIHRYQRYHQPLERLTFNPAVRSLMQHFPTLVSGLFTDSQLNQYLKGPGMYSFASALRELKSSIFRLQEVHITETMTITYSAGSAFILKASISDHGITWFVRLDRHCVHGDIVNEKEETIGDFLSRQRPFAKAELPACAQHALPCPADWDFWQFQTEELPMLVYKQQERIELVPTGRLYPLQVNRILRSALGSYVHLPKCDAAENSLFVNNKGPKPVYLFKDPTKTGPAEDDYFVVSYNNRLLQTPEHREILLSFNPKHQLHELKDGKTMVNFSIDAPFDTYTKLWLPKEDTQASTSGECEGKQLLSQLEDIRLDKCSIPRALQKLGLACNELGQKDGWYTVPKHDMPEVLKQLAFGNLKLIEVMSTNRKYGSSNIPVTLSDLCDECSPSPPAVSWLSREETSGRAEPCHDHLDAKAYEDALKSVPPAFGVQVQVRCPSVDLTESQKVVLTARYVWNPQLLKHKVLRLLPGIEETLSVSTANQVSVTTKVEHHHADTLAPTLAPFRESIKPLRKSSNLNIQPPSFVKKGEMLHERQQISVEWMVRREKQGARFVEREIEEEVVPELQLRLVGCAEREIFCRGGLIADDVGYGKTVITLALIDLQQSMHDEQLFEEREEKVKEDGREALNATLIIVPKHLTEQWKTEISKFLGLDSYSTVVIKTWTLAQKNPTIDAIRRAKIVIVSDAIFKVKAYQDSLQYWAGKAFSAEKLSERAYRAWHDGCVSSIRAFLREYRFGNKTDDELQNAISESRDADLEDNKALLANRVEKSSRRKRQLQSKSKKTPQQDSSKTRGKKIGSGMFMDANILLEFFTWNRIVWDEASEKNPETRQFVRSALADAKWLLTGTPPTRSLRELDSMAMPLGVHIAVPMDLRQGLPRITEGPSLSVRTDGEIYRSYGKNKSERYVEERHEQGEAFLSALSCANPVDVGLYEVEEKVVVCYPTFVELAYYLDLQQELRRADMDAYSLGQRSLQDLINNIRLKANFPSSGRDLGMQGLLHRASLPIQNAGEDPQASQALVNKRQELLDEAKACLKRVFEKTIWLAHRLQLSKVNIGITEKDCALDELWDLLAALEDGIFERFGGVDAWFTVAHTILSIYEHRNVFPVETLRDRINGPRPFFRFSDQIKRTDFLMPDACHMGAFMAYALMDGFSRTYAPKDGVTMAYAPVYGTSMPWEYVPLDSASMAANPDADAPVPDAPLIHFLPDAAYAARTKSFDHHYTVLNKDIDRMGMDEIRDLLQDYYEVKVTDTQEPADPIKSLINELEDVLGDIPDIRKEKLAKDIDAAAKVMKTATKGNKPAATTVTLDNTLSDAQKQRLRQALKKLLEVVEAERDRDGAANTQVADVSMYGDWSIAELSDKCRQRGLKVKTTSLPQLKKLLVDDANGTASDESYIGPNLQASRVRTPLQLVGNVLRTRGTKIEVLHDEYKQLYSKLLTVHQYLIDLDKQHRLAVCFNLIERAQKVTCNECQNNASYIVLECGHALCQEHHEGKVCCGYGMKECPSVLNTCTLSIEQIERSTKSAPDDNQSSKLRAIVDLVLSIHNRHEKVVIFAQHDAVLHQIVDALGKKNITAYTTTPRPNTDADKKEAGKGKSTRRKPAKSNVMKDDEVVEQFKQGIFPVLVLKLSSPEASGSNLVVANHMIFATPLITDCQEEYDAYMKQARGRCIREGQKKPVYIYHCLTILTAEVDVLELRTRQHVLVAPHSETGVLVDKKKSAEHVKKHLEQSGVSLQRINSLLEPKEVFKAMDESDYIIIRAASE
ncbi:uncharacterized protein BCR38DRAFT_406664 [Pseudomassariella vexata]|uniref:Helicase ATP-binding domain-containing protein n=1 Tax=Pseudomassariella vexata TaxID=1141098 RepID=A0A1Y2EBT2_9PEZI|nr:uncharacterized protein BCR38DRAFT_406664 [Pseudomassariella vexata]ORY68764.1 hypothetical protein BCR38DRAFT_406664 [Pseudomassariella vexata]